MSSPLALSAVTATLQKCLQLVYNGSVLGTVGVSAVAPDLVNTQSSGGQDAGLRVNLFLHQVTPNVAWRNVAQPSISANGGTRLTNPPLALDLHYLLTAYASDDTEAEALLGYAILMLHENPILPRSLITNVLGTPTGDTYKDAVIGAGIESQIEMIKITPATLGREEMAWLWTALKADYRPTFPFQASVVLMRNDNPTVLAPPVLVPPNITVQPGILAQLFSVLPPNDQAAAIVGETVSISGSALNGASLVSLVNSATHVSYPLALGAGNAQATRVSFVVPDNATKLPSGVCQASVLFTDASNNVTQHTNAVVLPIGLTLTSPSASSVDSDTKTQVSLSCNPQVRPGQQVYLLMQSQADNSWHVIAAEQFPSQTGSLTFLYSKLTAGTYTARLQVDGVLGPVAPGTITVPA